MPDIMLRERTIVKRLRVGSAGAPARRTIRDVSCRGLCAPGMVRFSLCLRNMPSPADATEFEKAKIGCEARGFPANTRAALLVPLNASGAGMRWSFCIRFNSAVPDATRAARTAPLALVADVRETRFFAGTDEQRFNDGGLTHFTVLNGVKGDADLTDVDAAPLRALGTVQLL